MFKVVSLGVLDVAVVRRRLLMDFVYILVTTIDKEPSMVPTNITLVRASYLLHAAVPPRHFMIDGDSKEHDIIS